MYQGSKKMLTQISYYCVVFMPEHIELFVKGKKHIFPKMSGTEAYKIPQLATVANLIQCLHNSKVNHGIIKLYRCSHCTLSDYTLQR